MTPSGPRRGSLSSGGPGALAGKLYVVATPIGNMGDITYRAVETLRAVDLIVAEDTRRARSLLAHLAIAAPFVERLDASASAEAVTRVVDRLEKGESVALVTDAGTPVVSDPGAALVAAARARGLVVAPIPGPSALTALLSVAGFEAAAVTFIGFLPRGGRDRDDAIAAMSASSDATVFFEAPHRMTETLALLGERMPRRTLVVGRELTKLHEEILTGAAEELATSEKAREWLGEIAVAVGPDKSERAAPTGEEIDRRIGEELAKGRRAKEIAELVSLETGLPKREIYERVIARRPR